MHKLIEEILKKGFSLELSYNNEGFEYRLGGFYKSDAVVLYENDYGSLTAFSRYDQVKIIETFYDLVSLNYEWWQSSKDRYEGWNAPDSKWLPFLIEEGFVKEKTNIVKTYE